MDTTVIPEQPDQNSSSPCNANRNTILGELQSVVDKRFASLDFGDRVSRDASKLIGFGTYGDVYEGILNPTQTKVAVKVVRYGDKSALPALERVLREIYVWSKLKHKNVIELLGITTAFDHTISIVSPLMSRGNAFDYVQNQDVDPRPLILGIANGLHYLHTYEQGHIIHGDIKGSNVLVSDDGRALLTDFGFSHLAAASFSLAIEQRQGGSLCWMAPEYLKADDFTMTTAGDVWAFGMTVLELFTRKHPFDHLKGIGVVLNHILYNLEWERPSSDASCSRLTDEWWNVCLSCWNRDPSQRTPISSVVKNIRTLQTLSKVITNSVPLDNATARRPEYPNLGVLDQLAERASRYNILNGRVFRDGLVYPNNFCNIHLGTLQVAAGRTVVYSSRDNENAIKVGIKTPRVGLRGDTEAAKNIFREAHIQSKLRHKHILPLLGITTDFDLTASIVTPWMEKGNAHDYVQDRAIDPRPLIWEIGLGLHYLHNHSLGPIIHGDLKGYNVVISDDGRALLHDFSLSLSRNYSFSASVSGYLGGTLNWAAPELLDSGHASTESDVWAFGMIALELFTRRIPFHDSRTISTTTATE
ncbi:kinase-like domain-containing protein [Scleroderma yunnanense]